METFHFLWLMYFGAFCLVVSVLAQDQSGFISIDCGIPDGSTYTDDTTGINYVSDASFTSTGVPKSVSSEYTINTLQRQLQNLRSFPEGSRNCYILNPAQGKGKKYLIRANFMYGNYDGENNPPEFALFLGANSWDTVKLDNASVLVTKEIVYLNPYESIYVCLGNKGKGTPFMSTLELRFLGNDNKTYDAPNGALFFSRRWDFGSVNNVSVRYKDDVYDRIWIPRNFGYCRPISTSLPVDANNSFNPPAVVMSTAFTPINTTTPITMTLLDSDPNSRYYVYMHFAEVEELRSNQTREFNIAINNETVIGPFSPKYLQTETFVLTPDSQAEINFLLVRTGRSTLPPIINALEIYVASKFLQSQTSQDDADAIMDIKSKYQVKKNWQGDPCKPQDYTWVGLNCSYDSYNPPRITSVNLSSSGLTGHIAPSFSNLTMIQELDLSNNSLTGGIPEFLSKLQLLRILNLEQNKLTGRVPTELLERSKNGSLILRVGENPGLCSKTSCRSKNKLVIPLVAVVAALLVLSVLFALFWRHKRRTKQVDSATEEETNRRTQRDSLVSQNMFYTYTDVIKMTNNFERILGKGGFGTVYHGRLDNHQEVAVKLLSESSAQGYKEFRTEVEVLMRVHHVNLTALIGYFHEGDHMGLIYEYMANGNMADYLSGKHGSTLNWAERLQIALDAAQGLEYLHCGCKPPIVHRDVKTSNILLNDKKRAKLADFGLSRSFQTESRSHLSTFVAGTPGYLDPVYYATNWLNEKSDVYSFGVVLLEMVTGQSVIKGLQSERIHISDWVISILKTKNDISYIVDPNIGKDSDSNSIWKVVELALASVSQTPSERPNMHEILLGLKESLQKEVNRKKY